MIELARNLSYQRSLSPGKAVFFYKTKDSEFEPLEAESNRLRGVKCSFSEAYSGKGEVKNGDAVRKLPFGNPIFIESCFAPPLVEHIYCRFSLRAESNVMQPLVCSDLNLAEHLKDLAIRYRDAGGFDELARRYCINLMSGAWLWNNQRSRDIEVSIKVPESEDDLAVSNLHRQGGDPLHWDDNSREVLEILSSGMSRSFHDSQVYWFADITAKIRVEFCQEIFPSQVFMDRSDVRGMPTKQLAKVAMSDGRSAVCFTSTKVGAALQMVDNWWEKDAENSLRVGEYGADSEFLIARRSPATGRDFYSILMTSDGLLENFNRERNVSPDYHYLMAVLAKGGMFQRGKSG
ncbi:CRISPR-associated protein Csy3 [Modicisalibacter muralis]|uniref:CRISPR-associated protein Csy3 n=1 Tax=Modicisalibacter muralis TaxID=119000 RepID=A0A1G9LI37_9GAMM|nr:type I-F CRISPR-associated protein Csy3 [Halomonas muralis]SDL61453.1 CRISPR-associated protein Csy3 [Halomonas muralis]